MEVQEKMISFVLVGEERCCTACGMHMKAKQEKATRLHCTCLN